VDPGALKALLALDVVMYSDGGGKRTAATRPVVGLDRVSQFFAGLARKRLRQAYRNAARRGGEIQTDSPSDDVHALRKRCKELRYLLEVFKPVCDNSAHRALLKELKSLQDTLGDFQDGEVQREAVREFAAAMMQQGTAPPATVLAMGEMAAQLDAHQLTARAALAGRLQPFLADENRARVKELVR